MLTRFEGSKHNKVKLPYKMYAIIQVNFLLESISLIVENNNSSIKNEHKKNFFGSVYIGSVKIRLLTAMSVILC